GRDEPPATYLEIGVAHEAYLPPAQIAALARGAAELLGLASAIEPADVVNLTGYVGEGYGVPSDESLAAIGTLGAAEGILLDPVYSGKGFAGLLDHCRRGLVAPGERVVFVHTGGLPALFGYADALTPRP
ncbi:pyridoxal-phosphate dependent enzyme, partial [Nonomuraea sp. NPDC055795]